MAEPVVKKPEKKIESVDDALRVLDSLRDKTRVLTKKERDGLIDALDFIVYSESPLSDAVVGRAAGAMVRIDKFAEDLGDRKTKEIMDGARHFIEENMGSLPRDLQKEISILTPIKVPLKKFESELKEDAARSFLIDLQGWNVDPDFYARSQVTGDMPLYGISDPKVWGGDFLKGYFMQVQGNMEEAASVGSAVADGMDLSEGGRLWWDLGRNNDAVKAFEDALRAGDFKRAMEMLPETSRLGQDLGQFLDHAVIFDVKEGSALIMEFGVPIKYFLPAKAIRMWEDGQIDKLDFIIYMLGAEVKAVIGRWVQEEYKITDLTKIGEEEIIDLLHLKAGPRVGTIFGVTEGLAFNLVMGMDVDVLGWKGGGANVVLAPVQRPESAEEGLTEAVIFNPEMPWLRGLFRLEVGGEKIKETGEYRAALGVGVRFKPGVKGVKNVDLLALPLLSVREGKPNGGLIAMLKGKFGTEGVDIVLGAKAGVLRPVIEKYWVGGDVGVEVDLKALKGGLGGGVEWYPGLGTIVSGKLSLKF